MAVFVDDDTSLKSAVSVRGGLGPDVHAHAAVLAVGGRGEVGVVGAGAVLGVEDDEVVALAALAVVVGLEVAGRLGEAEVVQQVVVRVGRVEELGDRGVGVRRRGRQRRVPVVLELERRACRAVVAEVVRTAVGVGLRDAVVCWGKKQSR